MFFMVMADTFRVGIVMHETGGIDGAGRAVQTFTCDDGAPAAGDSQR